MKHRAVWTIMDNKRDIDNVVKQELRPSNSAAEGPVDRYDMLSNGFKLRSSASRVNGSGNTIIYMAFAERSLVGTNNVPALAR